MDTTLAKLLEGWLDGGLSDAEQSDLLGQLGGDAELRRRFAEQVAMLGATRAAADSNPRWLALFDLLDHGDGLDGTRPSFEVVTMGRIDGISRPALRGRSLAWGLAAAVALLLAGGFLFKFGLPKPSETVIADSLSGSLETPDVAVVLANSAEAGFEAGVYLKPGVIAQSDGWITLQTFKGVSVTFDAPFEAVLSGHDRIRLNKGRARVHVPPGAEGFRLESPAFDVVDLGTEFAAIVHEDGTGTCRVFEGKADVFLLDSVGEVKQTRRLTARKSVRINPSSDAIEWIEEKDDDYPVMKQGPRPSLTLAPSYAADVLGMAPAGYWRFEAVTSDRVVPNEMQTTIQMHAVGSASITTEGAGNHAGALTQLGKAGFFKVQGDSKPLFKGDFTLGFFAQLSWLQNFAMISAMRYDNELKGHSLILQCYASLAKIGIDGPALHSVLRDPPAWDGGVETVGRARLRPLHWHHFTMMRHNGTVTLLLDGEAVACESTGSMELDFREIFIGRLNGNTSQQRTEARGMVGHIDELAIFPRALTDEEIRRLAIQGMAKE